MNFKGLTWSLYCYFGNKNFFDHVENYVGREIKINDIIEVICDTSEKILSFKVNAHSYGELIPF